MGVEGRSISAEISRLRCTTEVRLPLWLRVMGVFIGNNFWVRKHLVEETGGFALDVTQNVLQAA